MGEATQGPASVSTAAAPDVPHHFVDPRNTPFTRPKSRGELPHLHKPGGTYFVTFRLADAVEMAMHGQAGKMPAPQANAAEAAAGQIVVQASSLPSVHAAVNMGAQKELTPEEAALRCEPPIKLGSCALARDSVAALVQSALLHFHEQRYHLHAWCVMPNHVHVVVTPLAEHGLSDILHSWKSYSSKKANALLGQSGPFWERESFDHLCRTPQQVQWFVQYTEQNPVQAGLCHSAQDWPFSSCGAGILPARIEKQAGSLHHNGAQLPHTA